MISPHTAPGTKIICIKDIRNGVTIPNINCGEKFTVARIGTWEHGYCVEVVEIDHSKKWAPVWWKPWQRYRQGYDLSYFDYLSLPDCLTRLLNSVPKIIETEQEKEKIL